MGIGLFKTEIKPHKIEDLAPAQESFETANIANSPILSQIIENINNRKKSGHYDYTYDGDIPAEIRDQIEMKKYKVKAHYAPDVENSTYDTIWYRNYTIEWDFFKSDISAPEDR
jgi:hypothetical protein